LFPDTCIKAKNFIVVKTNQICEGLCADFYLENTGELYLSYETNSIIDSLNYGQQLIGASYGRFPNGFGYFTYMQPTIGRNNLMGNFQKTDILIFPNPTSSNTVYLKMICPQENASYEIYNSLGQKIQSERINTFYSNEEIFNIDVTNIKSGVYFIKVNSNNDLIVKKFIIQK